MILRLPICVFIDLPALSARICIVTDEQSFALARSISRKIESELQYPGQIRVTVLRETRCVEFAK